MFGDNKELDWDLSRIDRDILAELLVEGVEGRKVCAERLGQFGRTTTRGKKQNLFSPSKMQYIIFQYIKRAGMYLVISMHLKK